MVCESRPVARHGLFAVKENIESLVSIPVIYT
jgi:hypothetical protein